MKHLCSFIILHALSSFVTSAQSTSDTTLKLSDIKLSNAPSFSLLDVSPSSIEAPVSTKAFVVSISNAINHGNGIPQNYALEVTPFWFFKHRNFTSDKYIGISSDKSQGLPFAHTQFFSLSLAIINADSTTNVGHLANHNASIGIRGNFIRFLHKRTIDSIVEANGRWHKSLQDRIHALPRPGDRPTQDQVEALENSGPSWGDTIKAYLQDKPLFALDYAAATNMAFPTNTFNSNRISKTGIWLEGNFSFNIPKKNKDGKKEHTGNYFNLYTIARYIHSNDSLANDGTYLAADLLDFGAKAEIQFSHLFLGYEYIHRTNSLTGSDTYKSVGLLQYKIKDGLFLSGAIGQNFGTLNNLIASLGINWGFSNGAEKIE